jgi:hypothetical protein
MKKFKGVLVSVIAGNRAGVTKLCCNLTIVVVMPCGLVGINRLRRILPLPKRQFISHYIASRVGRDN